MPRKFIEKVWSTPTNQQKIVRNNSLNLLFASVETFPRKSIKSYQSKISGTKTVVSNFKQENTGYGKKTCISINKSRVSPAQRAIKNMKKTLTIAALMGLAASASAATITYIDTVSVSEGVNTPINLPKFNLAGQTLMGVTIGFTLSVPSFTLAIDNDSANAATGNISFGTLGSVVFVINVPTLNNAFDSVDSGDFAITTQSSTINVDATSGDNTGLFNNTGLGDYGEYTTSSILQGDTNHAVMTALIGNYAGAGNFNTIINVDFVADFNLTSGGGGGGEIRFPGNIPTATYSGVVTYTYVPEPSTAALLGLVGAGALLRRRRA